MDKNKANVPKIRFPGFTDPWEQRKVGDYYCFKNGLNKGKEFFGHGVPIVNFTDVFHNRGINASNLKGKVNLQPSEIANYKVQKGDIFFTRTSETIDEIGYSSVMIDEPKDTVFSGFVLRGRAFQEDPLTIKFKQYVFYTDEFRKEMIKKSSMTTRALTSGTAIKQMEIYFPKNKREQDKIGDYFEKLDKLITLHQRKLNHLQDKKKSLLQKMFPKNGEDFPELRFPGFTDPWEQRKLGELVKYVVDNRGKNPKYYCENGIPIIDNFMIKNNCYPNLKEATRFINEDLFNNFIRKYNEVDDILITLVGNGIGNIALFPKEKSVIIQNTLGLRFEENKKFMYYSMLSKNKEIVFLDRGMAQPSIRQDELLNLDFAIPNNKEQNKISKLMFNVDNLIILHQRKLKHLQEQKKALLQQMFV